MIGIGADLKMIRESILIITSLLYTRNFGRRFRSALHSIVGYKWKNSAIQFAYTGAGCTITSKAKINVFLERKFKKR